MIDEGIYLFFDNEIERAPPFAAMNFSEIFREDIKRRFMRFDFEPSDIEEDQAELKPLSEQDFNKYCRMTRTVIFVCIKSLRELEFALAECAELTDKSRAIISNKGLLFAAEIWDASCFWTGASIRRWFKARFPLKPKEVKYSKPPSVLDLLYEFLESVPHSQDNRLILKETLLKLPEDDRVFVKNILSGKNPKNSKETQETSARILRALMDRKV
jgi:hypothetical protein